MKTIKIKSRYNYNVKDLKKSLTTLLHYLSPHNTGLFRRPMSLNSENICPIELEDIKRDVINNTESITPGLAYKFCVNIYLKRIPELEDYISEHTSSIMGYIDHFELHEEVKNNPSIYNKFLKDREGILYYTLKITKSRGTKEMEDILFSKYVNTSSIKYIHRFIKGREERFENSLIRRCIEDITEVANEPINIGRRRSKTKYRYVFEGFTEVTNRYLSSTNEKNPIEVERDIKLKFITELEKELCLRNMYDVIDIVNMFGNLIPSTLEDRFYSEFKEYFPDYISLGMRKEDKRVYDIESLDPLQALSYCVLSLGKRDPSLEKLILQDSAVSNIYVQFLKLGATSKIVSYCYKSRAGRVWVNKEPLYNTKTL